MYHALLRYRDRGLQILENIFNLKAKMSSIANPTAGNTPENLSYSHSTTTSFSSVSSIEVEPLSVLVSSRALIQSTLLAASIVISQVTGKITAIHNEILPPSHFPPGTTYHDYSPLVLLPGLVDAHVHLNEPGRTEWEGFYTGTRAAAFGGVTTVVDMPLNAIPPTTTVANLQEKVAAAEGKCWVDVGFYGGLVPGNTHELVPLVKAGVRGFKGFLIDSGVCENSTLQYITNLVFHKGPRIPSHIFARHFQSTNHSLQRANSHHVPRRNDTTHHCLRWRRSPNLRTTPSAHRPPNSLLYLPRLPAPKPRNLRHRRNHLPRAPRTHHTTTHRSPLRSRSHPHPPRCKQEQHPNHSRNVFPLPKLRSRIHPRRGHPPQMLPTHPQQGKPRRPLDRTVISNQHNHFYCFRPLPLHTRTKNPPYLR